MFRITEDPSSGSPVQCLAKITKMVLWQCLPIQWTTHTHNGSEHAAINTDHVHVNGHDRNSFVILAKKCTRLPDDGFSVIRNMLEHFQIFYNFDCIYKLYICELVG